MANTPVPENDPTSLRPEDSIRVAEIRAALIEEMRASEEGKSATSVIKDVTELKEDALASLKHVIKHSPNESLKARVSMWAIDKVIEAEKANDDPLAEFLKGLPEAASTSST